MSHFSIVLWEVKYVCDVSKASNLLVLVVFMAARISYIRFFTAVHRYDFLISTTKISSTYKFYGKSTKDKKGSKYDP